MAVSITLNVTSGSTLVGTVTVRATVAGLKGGNFVGSLYVDGAPSGSSNLPLTFTLDTTLLRNGSRVLEVRAKYKGVTYKSSPVTVNVNNPLAAVITQSITAGEVLSGTETWAATVSGIADIARVDFYVDGTVTGTDASSPFSYSLDTTLLGEGSHQFYVSVVQTSGAHTDSAVVSATVQNVVPAAPVNTVAPAITGTAQQGNVLSVSTGTWTGEPAPIFNYQWVRTDTAGANPVNIVGATSATYTLTAADVGFKVKARVTGTNPTATVAAFSALTATVIALGGSLPVNTAAPTLSGTTQEGQTLTVSAGAWTGSPSYTYQWYRCDSQGHNCVPVGAGATTYALTSVDVGGTIICRVTASNASGSVVAYTGTTAVIAAAAATPTIPANTGVPTMSGTTTVGQTLTANPGTWTGNPTPQYRYQWIRCNSQGTAIGDITGQTASTYLLHAEDLGGTVRVRVTGFNSAGETSVTSAASAVIVSSTPPPPPTGFASPLGFLSYNDPGYFPPTELDEYGVIVGDGPAPAAFRGVNLQYRTAITCQNGSTNISEATCLTNGWEMRDASGPLTNVNYGGVLGDPGLAAYQQAWCQAALAKLTSFGADGLFIDDINPRVWSLSGGRRPTKYPTDASYEAAIISMMQAIHAFFWTARGLKDAYNTAIVNDNTGALTDAWFRRIGAYATWLSVEYWMTPSTFTRLVGGEWWNNWDGWRGVHRACLESGTSFLPLSEARAEAYSLGTFMLDWNGGVGANLWVPAYSGTTDPWITAYAQARALGLPTAAATKVGNVWRRQHQNGLLQVDPTVGTATFTVG